MIVMIDPNDNLLTLDQVAEILQVSRPTVYEFIKDETNSLPIVYLSDRTPRIRLSKLNEWIEIQTNSNESKGGE